MDLVDPHLTCDGEIFNHLVGVKVQGRPSVDITPQRPFQV